MFVSFRREFSGCSFVSLGPFCVSILRIIDIKLDVRFNFFLFNQTSKCPIIIHLFINKENNNRLAKCSRHLERASCLATCHSVCTYTCTHAHAKGTICIYVTGESKQRRTRKLERHVNIEFSNEHDKPVGRSLPLHRTWQWKIPIACDAALIATYTARCNARCNEPRECIRAKSGATRWSKAKAAIPIFSYRPSSTIVRHPLRGWKTFHYS